MKWLTARLAEPSTKNAIALGCTIGAQVAPAYSPLLLAIAGLLASGAAVQKG